MNNPTSWAIYARKSSESEEKQAQSIPDQVAVLTQLAYRSGIMSFEIITEEKSAKAPDARTGFSKLIQAIEKGEIDGIICWKLDRLSRNPIDSARIQWMLQKGKIKSIKTFDREYRPEDNAIIFAVEQGMANQWIRELSSNVKRALLQKAERGDIPAWLKWGISIMATAPGQGGLSLLTPSVLLLFKKCGI